MNFVPVIEALALPAEARVDQRVPKKLLIEQGAPTASDKRHIQAGIEEMIWVVALKPTNSGVSLFRDEGREYLEIAVLTVALRPEAKPTRLIELIHRAIPYPVALLAGQGDTLSLSLAHKRWSQGEAGKVVIEEMRRGPTFDPERPNAQEAAFLASLAVSILPRADLFALYQGLLDRVVALEAAQLTGTFAPPDTPGRAEGLRESLAAHATLQRNIAALRAQAVKERQINRRVELNLTIKRLEAELASLGACLSSEKAR